jgi:aminoglycoside phosphotransferase (APT) family kinase protein
MKNSLPSQELAAEILEALQAAGFVKEASPIVTALTGGVSCEIWRVEEGGRRFVVKRALPKLRVEADWHADVARNRYEQNYLRYVGGFLPEAVPKILLSGEKWDFFVMEFLDGDFVDWKKHLLAGEIDPWVAEAAGRTLGQIHGRSWEDGNVARQFDTGRNFHDLRIAPYLLATAEKYPELAPSIYAEASRLAGTRRALVHGDYSPKNLMVAPDRLVVLDCEVAWYGDPAFDVSFLTSHLLLKSLHRPSDAVGFLGLIDAFLAAYRAELGDKRYAVVAADCPRLLLCLLLARVDGKSPVEYLADEGKRDFLRGFAARHLLNPPEELSECLSLWRDALPKFPK